jgi:cytochrome bd-type quinol oxidase subunit 2
MSYLTIEKISMNKIFLICIFTLIIGLVLCTTPKGLDATWFGFMPVIFVLLLLPFIGGILLVLVQNKNRSYEFLPALLVGSCFNGTSVAFVLFFAEYFRSGYLYGGRLYLHNFAEMFLPFVVLSLFGGMIGLVIRGITLLSNKKSDQKSRANE